MDLFQMWLSSKSLGHAGTCHTKWAVELWSTEAAAFRSELSSLWHAGACLFGKASGLCGDETSPPQMGKQEFACSERPPAFVVTRTSPPQRLWRRDGDVSTLRAKGASGERPNRTGGRRPVSPVKGRKRCMRSVDT